MSNKPVIVNLEDGSHLICDRDKWTERRKKTIKWHKDKERRRDPYQKQRENGLKSTYNLSWGEYTKLHDAQYGACAICKLQISIESNNSHPRACVDHDHDTGEVRGLLCNTCNTALGLFKEDPETMEAAAEYIREHS